MVYVGFCGGGDGFVGFCGLLVEVSVVGWWVWQRWWLVERERERVNINAIFFCWGFMVVVLWVVGGGPDE